MTMNYLGLGKTVLLLFSTTVVCLFASLVTFTVFSLSYSLGALNAQLLSLLAWILAFAVGSFGFWRLALNLSKHR